MTRNRQISGMVLISLRINEMDLAIVFIWDLEYIQSSMG
jgi:hypothetical protein